MGSRIRVCVGALVVAAALLAASNSAYGAAWNFEMLDGNGAPGGNGRTPHQVTAPTVALLFAGQPHLWYFDGDDQSLRHAWWSGTNWNFEVLDGPGALGGNGRTGDALGGLSAVTLYAGLPHLWYTDVVSRSLRHAWWSGAEWVFETLDGGGAVQGNGRTTDDVGAFGAATLFAELPHVWYENSTTRSMRHAWWTGARWNFETLDGTGSTGAGGRTTHDVGTHTVVTTYERLPHVWYVDDTDHSLRHAWWTGTRWNFEVLDGPGAPGGNGRTTDEVGTQSAVTLYAGRPHLWYSDLQGSLRHGWWTGSTWLFETLDGYGSPTGDGRVGTPLIVGRPAVTLLGGLPHVWYIDLGAGSIRHAWWNGSRWRFEYFDGPAAPHEVGQTTDQLGGGIAAVVFAGAPHVWYGDILYASLRHAWFN